MAFDRLDFVERPDFAPDAVDDDALGAILAHQVVVVDAFDAGLSDDVAALQIGGGRNLRVARLADIAEEMRRHRVARILARRHFLDHHVGQLEIQPARRDRRDLRQRRILHDRDRPIGRLAPVAIDDLADARFRHVQHQRQHADRVIQILRVLAHDRDAVRVAVHHQRLHVAIEHDAARRAQGERALMVVLGHFLELLVLHDLQDPEAHRQRGEEDDDGVLEDAQADADPPAILTRGHG